MESSLKDPSHEQGRSRTPTNMRNILLSGKEFSEMGRLSIIVMYSGKMMSLRMEGVRETGAVCQFPEVREEWGISRG